MVTYTLYKILRDEALVRSDGVSIPFDPANTDYQAFLKYQAEGGKVYGADEEIPVINTPLPADE
jgi:hypothetical protein